MPEDAHAQAISTLSGLGPLRVWSLLVTVFGDLAPDGSLDGPTLSSVMDGIGIRAEATRVALHRLRADGWITSHKQGRISAHSLTPKGQQDSLAARPRIYGRPDAEQAGAKLVLMPDSAPVLDPADFAPVAPQLYLCATDTTCPDDAMILDPDRFPAWLGHRIEPTALRQGYAALHSALNAIAADADRLRDLDARDTAVLRVMIVHTWRRLVLKHPALPRDAHSHDWKGHACRALATQLLDRYPRPTLDRLRAT